MSVRIDAMFFQSICKADSVNDLSGFVGFDSGHFQNRRVEVFDDNSLCAFGAGGLLGPVHHHGFSDSSHEGRAFTGACG